jgi:virginiamycin B lyase
VVTGRLALLALAALGAAACFDPHSRLGAGFDGAAGAGGAAAGSGGGAGDGAAGAGGGGAGAGGGGVDAAAGADGAAGAGDAGDAGPADPCATIACDDMHICVAGACASRYAEFPLPYNRYPGVDVVTRGPDGDPWIVASSRSAIGHVLPTGDMTLYPLPGTEYGPGSITAGPDGNLWFTVAQDHIGVLDIAGTYLNFYAVPTAMSTPVGIVAGADGNLWFTEFNASQVGRITTAGDVKEFPTPTSGSEPYQIVASPNGDLWYLSYHENLVGHVTPAGDVNEIAVVNAQAIAAGPDGNLYLGVALPSWRVVRLTPGGDRTDFVLPDPIITAEVLTFDPAGNLWFVEDQYQRTGVVRMTPQGEFREITFPNPAIDAYGIRSIAVADGYVWCTELYKSAIGRVTPW